MPAADTKVRRPTSPTAFLRQQRQQQQRMSYDFDSIASSAQEDGARGASNQHCQLQCCCSPSSSSSASSTSRRPQLHRNAFSEYSTPRIFSKYTDYSIAGADGVSDEQPNDEHVTIDDFGDLIDQATFEQILEMDDDEEEREFSKSIVYDFFEQAHTTFENMHKKLEEKDLDQLSALGHFLKGSSATLGLTKVKDSCEKIQHFGARKDETGNKDVDDDKQSLKSCETSIKQAEKDFTEAEALLRKFYREESS
ncbi:Putative histidine-containing phosphotransfer protein 1-5/Phosphorelay intermediate protein YPD1 [Septoria linicola]|uniref:Histidine-containing phosphotransfer protein 1-5/Phosphorelay intermediate protein YPD1 n=1 Tax=Septoria linicola TaxID=215465 RepID=A0A9Q9AHX4_9PEZI|nr:Putative histidine-containing phosphotransfer protein 1-5/Phosphorelay intermediate protein YPD1 [Septoria linicola]